MELPWRPFILASLCVVFSSALAAAEPTEEPTPASVPASPETAPPADNETETVEPGEDDPPATDTAGSDLAETLTFAPDPGQFLQEVPRPASRPACRSACQQRCPDYCRYGIFDVLFLQRDNGADGSTIAEDTAGGQPAALLTNQDAHPATSAGVRLFYGMHGPNRVGWEIGYTGVYGMFGEAREEAAGQIQIPGGLGQAVQGWATANAVRPTYASSLNMFEANVFQHRSCIKGGRHSPFPWDRVHDPYCHSFNWLFGLRWAGLNETADLNVQTDPGEPFSAYSVTTSSQLIGPQIGIKERRQWNNWAVEGWAKTMLAGTFLSSYADPIGSPLAPGVEYRPAREDTEVGVGFVADLNYSLARRLGEHWWLRVGYNLIWVTGVALGPNQYDFTDTATSGSRLVGGSSVFLHGANLGVEARW